MLPSSSVGSFYNDPWTPLRAELTHRNARRRAQQSPYRFHRIPATIPLIATHAPKRPLVDLRDEHIGSRKDWGAYVNLSTMMHRRDIAQIDDFIAQLRARLEQAMRRHP